MFIKIILECLNYYYEIKMSLKNHIKLTIVYLYTWSFIELVYTL